MISFYSTNDEIGHSNIIQAILLNPLLLFTPPLSDVIS